MTKQDIERLVNETSKDKDVQEQFVMLIKEIMDSLKETNPKEAERIERKMMYYDNGNSKMLNEEDVEYLVNELYQKNNVKQSERMFNMQKVEQLAKQHGLKLDGYSLEDLYLVLVMAETDFKELLGSNMDNYMTFARLWLDDRDYEGMPCYKLYDYMCYVTKMMECDDKGQYDNGYNNYDNNYGSMYDDRYGMSGHHQDENLVRGNYYGNYSYPRGYSRFSNGNRSMKYSSMYDNGSSMQNKSYSVKRNRRY